jgi:hypothetical protein
MEGESILVEHGEREAGRCASCVGGRQPSEARCSIKNDRVDRGGGKRCARHEPRRSALVIKEWQDGDLRCGGWGEDGLRYCANHAPVSADEPLAASSTPAHQEGYLMHINDHAIWERRANLNRGDEWECGK